MIRGTTPTLRFILPFSVELLDVVYITMQQDGDKVIEKTMDDCEAKENVLTVRLTQAETLELESGRMTEIQIRARMKSGDAVASEIMRTPTNRILKEGVI